MNGAQLAAAVVGGYLLGRTKKMKFAIMLGSALAGKKISTNPADLLAQASKLIAASPELQRVDQAVRGRLLEAGKEAAMAAASSRMETLTDTLVSRVEGFGRPVEDAAGDAAGAAGDTAGSAGRAATDTVSRGAGKVRKAGRRGAEEPAEVEEPAEDVEDAEDAADDQDLDEAEEDDPAAEDADADDAAADDSDEAEDTPAPARGGRRSSSSEGKSSSTTGTKSKSSSSSGKSRSSSGRESSSKSTGNGNGARTSQERTQRSTTRSTGAQR